MELYMHFVIVSPNSMEYMVVSYQIEIEELFRILEKNNGKLEPG